MKKLVLLLSVIMLSATTMLAYAQTGARPGTVPDLAEPGSPDGPVGSEGFDDITLLPPLGYILSNQSNPLGPTDWFQGNDGVFSAQAGASTAYIAANFNNTGGIGQVCNWLVLPDLGQLASVTFWTRGPVSPSFPDRLKVVFSPTGGTSLGNCSGGYGDFTTELLSINDGLVGGGYPDVWTEFTVNPPDEGRVAFVYDVPNGGPSGTNSNYIGIDTLSYEIYVPPDHARFLVTKDFDDNNEAEVEVTLTCNTGLPLEQHWDISEGNPVNFVVGDFNQGELNCEVTEAGVGGYTASYDDQDGISSVNCSWEDLEGGQYFCAITNSLNQVDVDVDKVWIDEKPEFNAQNIASAYWYCSNVAWGTYSGYLQFFGNPGSDSFSVYPDWESGTTCSITEVDLLESGIEVDDSDCQGMVLWPDMGDTCTIYNTRLYEGIPTLSQYGLALLAMLMLGLGFVAFRRVM